jgi:hypothetical protein
LTAYNSSFNPIQYGKSEGYYLKQSNKVAGHMQLKDTISSSGVKKTIDQINSGHYSKTGQILCERSYEMEKGTVLSIIYEPSDTIEMQGKRSDIERYRKQGYRIKEERNGYWVLVKPAQVNITVSNSSGTRTFKMKQDILDFYRRDKISERLIEKFGEDIKKEKINIYMDAEGNYDIRKND